MSHIIQLTIRKVLLTQLNIKTSNWTLSENEKIIEHQGHSNTNCSWCTWNGAKKFRRKTQGTESKRKNRGHPRYGISKIG